MKRNSTARWLATVALLFIVSFGQLRILAEVSGRAVYIYAGIPAIAAAMLCSTLGLALAFGYDETEILPNVVLEVMQ